MGKLMSEIKEILTENKELNEHLKEQITEYEQLTKAFTRSIPEGFFQ